MRSQKINGDYWLAYCKAIFGKDLAPPNTQYYIDKYGGDKLKATNLILVNNIEDPWQYAGMRHLTDPTGTQKDMVAMLIDCQDCGHC